MYAASRAATLAVGYEQCNDHIAWCKNGCLGEAVGFLPCRLGEANTGCEWAVLDWLIKPPRSLQEVR